MLPYLVKRIIIFIPTLLVISLLTFGLSKMTPGDPVELILRTGAGEGETSLLDAERAYRETSTLLGLDKPAFYFAISSRAFPDTLYRIPDPDHRQTLWKLTAQYGNWPMVDRYYRHLRRLDQHLDRLSGPAEAITSLRAGLRQLYLRHQPQLIRAQLSKLEKAIQPADALPEAIREEVRELTEAYRRLQLEATPGQLYIPDIKWYGWDNQYHHWFRNMVRGDFGISYRDSRPVSHKLFDALRWTLLLNGLAIFFAYGLSIPLGVYSAVHRGSTFDRATSIGLFLLYSLPNFWIATLLVMFITTPEYGMDLFPTMGLGKTSGEFSFWTRFADRAYHLVLPVFCLTYGSLAFITRQMRGSMVDVFNQDYIRTARAKGLPERQVIWKHGFRNGLFPLITLFGSVFPAVLAGSVIIEVIFNIHGMGKLTVDAITQRDWPVVYAVLMLGAVLTMAGILVADVLYAIADPRVRFEKAK